ncbi:hypothetical protein [Peribacillus kribbensis]|uniref:hypothetical protein n=1 Tax=Peribacillus kribbensis TaxID=356658 RepID=UPI00042A5F84|nr:hypothetical protein [Peribacillus kribbensis]
MRILGCILFTAGFWMMVSPQAALGVSELKWMADYSFPGEALFGALFCSLSLLLFKPYDYKIKEK